MTNDTDTEGFETLKQVLFPRRTRRVPETVRTDWFVPGRRQAEWVGGRRIGGEVGRASAGCSRPSANRGRGRCVSFTDDGSAALIHRLTQNGSESGVRGYRRCKPE